MDFAQANVFAETLLGIGSIGGYELTKYISHGKSAVIMQAHRDGESIAIKIFHPGLIEQYGREAQLVRISRERELIGKTHPNIIRILDAGCCESSGHLFVAMAFAAGKPLSKALSTIPRENIPLLIEQLANATLQLENWGYTHRDIKPDNIHISDDLKVLTLLDLGVMKPHGDDSATSLQASRGFIGTHQYSPPEMIHGREKDTLDGWRAITFYQIGAVLHDLIARKPIFDASTKRHADLVAAIDHEPVEVISDDVDPRLCNLATRCLLKDPNDRLTVVQWTDFMFSTHDANKPSLLARREALRRQMITGTVLRRVDTLESAESRRLKAARFSTIVQSARIQFDGALSAMGSMMPMRSTTINGHPHPLPAITYTFCAAPKLGLAEPFRVQIAIALHETGSLVEVYGRASKVAADTEVGWSQLGAALENFDRFSEKFEEWLLGLIEELFQQ
jgi:eukaryotic-like serine/threonine-protein kinase